MEKKDRKQIIIIVIGLVIIIGIYANLFYMMERDEKEDALFRKLHEKQKIERSVEDK